LCVCVEYALPRRSAAPWCTTGLNPPPPPPHYIPKGPLELLLRCSGGCDVNGEQKLPEIDVSILVRVKGAEHVVAELLRVAAGEEELVHVHKLGRGEPAVGAVLLEAFVPLLDRVLVVAGVRPQELQVLLAQALLALDAAHAGGGGGGRGVKIS
jgi:hypothetical protein